MSLSEENKRSYRDELLKLKLKPVLTPEEKQRVQKLQQFLFGDR